MKKILALLVATLCLGVASGQNIVVEAYNGTPAPDVGSYIYGVTLNPDKLSRSKSSSSKVRFAFDIGYSYRLGKLSVQDAEARESLNKLKSGVTYGVDIHGFISPSLGLGGRINGRHYGSKFDYMGYSFEDKVNTIYIAPSLIYRGFSKNNENVWIMGFSIGYLNYTEKLTGDINETVSGSTVGTTLDIGYDIWLEGKTFLGFKLTLSSGSVSVKEYDDARENLSAVELSAGLRF